MAVQIMIKSIVYAGILGIVATLYYVQYDHWFQRKIADMVAQQFSLDAQSCVTYATVSDMQLVAGSITLHDVLVTSCSTKHWYWSAKTLTITFSWIALLLYGIVDLTLSLADVVVHTAYDQTCDMQEYLCSFVSHEESAAPIILRELHMQRMQVVVFDRNEQWRVFLEGTCLAKKIDNTLKSIIHFDTASAVYKNKPICTQLCANIDINTTHVETVPRVAMTGSFSGCIPCIDANYTHYTLSGNWHAHQGFLAIKNNEGLGDITVRAHQEDYLIAARMPLSTIGKVLYPQATDDWIKGSCQVKAKGTKDGKNIAGFCLCKEIVIAGSLIGSLGRITFDKVDEQWRGSLYVQRKSGVAGSGLWDFNELAKNGSVRLVNDTALYPTPSSSSWFIPVHGYEITLSAEKDGFLKGNFLCNAQHAQSKTLFSTAGEIKGIWHDKISIEGVAADNTYQAQVSLYPQPLLHSCLYMDASKKKLIDMKARASDKKIQGIIDFGCVREIINMLYAYDLQGEGCFDTQIERDSSCFSVALTLMNGTIRLPQTYNFIHDFSGKISCDLQKKQIEIDDMICQLHKGSLQAKHGIVHYSDDYAVSFVHMPLLLKDCLLNIQKDLFTIVSGYLLFRQSLQASPQLQGSILLMRSQLNENLFSFNVQQSLMRNAKNMVVLPSVDVGLDVSVRTAYPIRVKTPFLETDAQVQLQVSNTVCNPQVTGSITLHSGELSFPYKPLYIHKGSLYFMPNQLYDPMIELEARNMIKKHNISMHVTGSLTKHHIGLSANPPLTEEQIIALLLVGSQEESLNIVMPAIIMHNVKQLVFGSEQARNKLERYFTGFLKPLKHITLMPSFADQTGRGGLRGTIEVTVYDRLRALIQKNFSLTEDTRFEVEYMLSDDISLRAVRDERRDISGEVEMRWKF